jgi:SIR2-like domain
MLLRGLGIRRAVRSTLILGAGASRGASFADTTRQVLPPLDADFFRQAQRLGEQAFRGNVRRVIEFVRDDYGPARQPTLESVFTQLQGFEQFLKQFSTRPGRPASRYQKQLAYLQELIPMVFRAAFEEQQCAWHDRIAYALRKDDVVINFNYDALVDDSIRRLSAGIWRADRGYGFRIGDGADYWSAPETPGPFPKESLRLLKPHGSLHWEIVDATTKALRLRDAPYSGMTAKDNIIPPTWDKTILGEWPWKPTWEHASRALQQTRCLIVIGYSVPQTDLTSQALIRSSLSGGDLRLLVVANPDPRARTRVIELARGAIKRRTRILELDGIRDFAALLDETPGERTARLDPQRKLRTMQRNASALRKRLDEVDDRTEELDFHDISELDRIRELDDLDARLSRLEDSFE